MELSGCVVGRAVVAAVLAIRGRTLGVGLQRGSDACPSELVWRVRGESQRDSSPGGVEHARELEQALEQCARLGARELGALRVHP